jgi:hypothetical protein
MTGAVMWVLTAFMWGALTAGALVLGLEVILRLIDSWRRA